MQYIPGRERYEPNLARTAEGATISRTDEALMRRMLAVFRATVGAAAPGFARRAYAEALARAVIDRIVQIYGADGAVSDLPAERRYRETRSPRIYEGTSEIQKIFLARQESRKSQQGSTYQ